MNYDESKIVDFIIEFAQDHTSRKLKMDTVEVQARIKDLELQRQLQRMEIKREIMKLLIVQRKEIMPEHLTYYADQLYRWVCEVPLTGELNK